MLSNLHLLYWTKRRVTGRAKKIIPRPPPVPYTRPQPTRVPSNLSSPMADEQNQAV